MKAEQYNNREDNFMSRHLFMRHPVFRRMRRYDEDEMRVFSVKVIDRDVDELYLTIPASDERKIKHFPRLMFRFKILDIKEVWLFRIESQTKNEKMLIERGFFASEEPIEKEEDLKF